MQDPVLVNEYVQMRMVKAFLYSKGEEAVKN
jgi:hypothetical protein